MRPREGLLLDPMLELCWPETLSEEVTNHVEGDAEIQRKTRLSVSEIKGIFQLLISRIKITAKEKYEKKLPEALTLASHEEDAPYIALDLNCPIWSNDAALARQKKVRVITTTKLLQTLA